MSELKVGDSVRYVPCVETHWHDRDRAGEPVFTFVHVAEGPPAPHGQRRPQAGDPVKAGSFGFGERGHDTALGAIERRVGDGTLSTSKGCAIRPHRHVAAWEATVVRVNADGSADLDIKHPCGFVTLHYPDRAAHPDAPGIKHDPKHGFHTFHLPEEA